MPEAVTKKRFTADEYMRMVQVGILSERDRVELIDGEVVAMTPIGPRHAAVASRANRALVVAAGDTAIVQPAGSVRLGLYHQPEPDLVLLRPRGDFYASRHPEPADVLLVIEIAESSLAYDRTVKARVYAESDIHQYWLASLNEHLVFGYSSPARGEYRRVETYRTEQSIAPQLLPACTIAVDVLLAD